MPHWRSAGRTLCVEGTPGHEPPPALAPRAGEPCFDKTFFSAFSIPGLGRGAGPRPGPGSWSSAASTCTDASARPRSTPTRAGFGCSIAADATGELRRAARGGQPSLARRPARSRFASVDLPHRARAGVARRRAPATADRAAAARAAERGRGWASTPRRRARGGARAGRRAARRVAPSELAARDRRRGRQADPLRPRRGRPRGGAAARGGRHAGRRRSSAAPEAADAARPGRGGRADHPLEQPAGDPARQARARRCGSATRSSGSPRRRHPGSRTRSRDLLLEAGAPRGAGLDRRGSGARRRRPPARRAEVAARQRDRLLGRRLRGAGDLRAAPDPDPGRARRQQRRDRLVGLRPRRGRRPPIAEAAFGSRRAALHREPPRCRRRGRASTTSSRGSSRRPRRSRSATRPTPPRGSGRSSTRAPPTGSRRCSPARRRTAPGSSALAARGGSRGWPGAARYLEPAIVLDAAPDSEIVQRESFGPVLVVQRAGDLRGGPRAAQRGSTRGSSRPCSPSSSRLQESFLAAAEAGVLKLNRATADVGVETPFGGWGASGVGPPEHGPGDVEFYTRPQAIYG